MKINTIHLANRANVLVFEDFFNADHLAKMHALCDTLNTAPEEWITPDWTKLRNIYDGENPTYTTIKEVLSSAEYLTPIENILNKKLVVTGYVLWADHHKLGPLAPHVEGDGEYLAQIYIAKKSYIGGTTIYNDAKQPLFQLPYRDNLGWFFDKCTTVMHGRDQDVPAGLIRYSLMIWYNEY